jgi:tRNA(adenine34) deaminase
MKHPHEHYMRLALREAVRGARAGEVPIGALLVAADGEVISRAYNRPVGGCDPTAHAEIVALRRAARKLGNYRLPGTTLYVTLEPCAMCAGALVLARVACVVFGAPDPKGGAARTLYRVLDDRRLNHQAEVIGGVLEPESRRMLQAFFRERRGAARGPFASEDPAGYTHGRRGGRVAEGAALEKR